MKSILTILFFVSSTALANDCLLPFQTMVSPLTGRNFTTQDVHNDYAYVNDMYRKRYIVVNLDSVGDSGQCKGLNEHYPAAGEWPTNILPELNTPNGAATYQSILKYYRNPVNKGPIVNGNCIGQSVTMCELRGNQAVEIGKLGTSAANGDWGVPLHTYYSELMVINTRSWDSYSRAGYNQNDAARDEEMGGVQPGRLSGPRFVPYNGWNMPNFMNFIPAPGFQGNSQNGLHEISNGESLGSNLGAPVSHGCLRLTRYGAVFLRWWMPLGARMFIHYTDYGYRKYPPRR